MDALVDDRPECLAQAVWQPAARDQAHGGVRLQHACKQAGLSPESLQAGGEWRLRPGKDVQFDRQLLRLAVHVKREVQRLSFFDERREKRSDLLGGLDAKCVLHLGLAGRVVFIEAK